MFDPIEFRSEGAVLRGRFYPAVFASLGGPKELVEIDGGHFRLLHVPSQWFDDASRGQRDFLLRHLAAR